jgi:hypothetical protein
MIPAALAWSELPYETTSGRNSSKEACAVTKKLKTSEIVMLVGAVLVFIGTFMKWFKLKGSLGSFSGSSVSGFHYFLQGTIPWLLAVGVGVIIVLRAFFPTVKLPDMLGPLTWSQVYLIAGGVALFLIFTRIITVDGPSEFIERGLGIFTAFVGAIVMEVGAFLKYRAKEDAATAGPGTTPPTPF